MQRLKRSLPLRIAIPVITVTLTLGTFLYSFVLTTISDFAKTDIENDLKSISHRIYNICNTNYDSMLQTGPADDLTSRIITKAVTLGQLEDFYRQENIKGVIFDAIEKKFVVTTSLPCTPKQVLKNSDQPGKVVTLNKEAKDHFAFQFDFSPWDWQIVIIKNEEEYGHLISRVQNVYIYTLSLLFLATALLVFFLYRSVATPVNNIVKPLQHAKTPNYKGIDVFEYLSDSIRDMMCSLKQSEQRFRSLVETTSDLVWETDPAGYYTYVSPAVEEILGYRKEEVIGKHITHFFTESSQQEWLNRVPSGVSFEKHLHSCRTQGGREIFLESSGVPILDEQGEIVGYHGIDRDITQRLLAEHERTEYEVQQQQHKLESLGTFAGGIAHDFNNLLSIITGNISLAKMTVAPNEQIEDYLERASRTIDRAEELTGRLLTFAQGGVPNRKKCVVRSVLKNAAESAVTATMARCNFQISATLSNIIADKKQIVRAISNIIINAAESMDYEGDITITGKNIEIKGEQSKALSLPEGPYVKITIEDTGVGIDGENLSKIFDPYFTTKRMGVQKGTGLGLTVSFSIIQNHKGRLLARSESGTGTTFTIYLPAEDEIASTPRLMKQRVPTPFTVKKILLMDDEEMLRELAEMMFQNLGYQYRLAENGTEALNIYQQSMSEGAPCDLIILDLTIKEGMSGLETMRQLLTIDPDVRAIVSSGYTSDPAMLDHTKHGFIGSLSKPYELQDLKALIKDIETGRL